MFTNIDPIYKYAGTKIFLNSTTDFNFTTECIYIYILNLTLINVVA